MIHSTTFDKATIARSRVARRKGNRVRFFDPATARMSGWHKVAGPVPDYAAMKVSELFPLARSKFGMRVTTKTRKAELVRMLITNR